MKKVFLLSLLLPVLLTSTQSRADYFGSVDKVVAGVSAGLACAVSLFSVNFLYEEPSGPYPEIAPFVLTVPFTLLSVATGAATAALLNPTHVSSMTAAKLGAAVTAAISTGILARQAYRKNVLSPVVMGTLGAPAAAIGAVSLNSAFNENWQLKV